jgi:transposase
MISKRKESWTMGEEKRRKRWGPEEIARVLRRYLVEKVELSKVCEEAGCCPSQVCRWQKTLFDGAAATFSRRNGSPDRELKAAKARASELEEKLQRKHEVLSELMEEHVRLKKSLGEGS